MADIKGYYKILGVGGTATSDEIKVAYKAKAKELHPDINKNDGATFLFQQLQEAYEVLSNSNSRLAYDQLNISNDEPAKNTSANIEPIRCSKCGCITAQPRFVIFYDTVSVIVVTTKTPRYGIFCSKCAAKVSLKASLKTMLFGWWGFPFGPIYSIMSLYTNAIFGEKPRDMNFKVICHQAFYFLQNGQKELAYQVGSVAMLYAVSSSEKEICEEILRISSKTDKKLKDAWSVFGKNLFIHIGIFVVFILIVFGFVFKNSNKPNTYAQNTNVAASYKIPPINRYDDSSFNKPEIQMPVTGLITKIKTNKKAPLKISVTNSENNYFIKLTNIENRKSILAYIRKMETLDVDIPIGSYELKYAIGDKWYGEEYLFGPNTEFYKTDKILNFSITKEGALGHEIELRLQRNGNLHTETIGRDGF